MLTLSHPRDLTAQSLAMSPATLHGLDRSALEAVLGFLPTSSIIRLLETGDKVFTSHVYPAIQHLDLKGPYYFPTNLIRSATALKSLKLVCHWRYPVKGYENLRIATLPSSLRSLDLLISDRLFESTFCAVEDDAELDGALAAHMPHLESLSICIAPIEDEDEMSAQYEPRFSALIKNLNLTTLKLNGAGVHLTFLEKVPATVTVLQLDIAQGEYEGVSLPPNVLDVSMRGYLTWGFFSTPFPASLVDLRLMNTSYFEDSTTFPALPANLTTLALSEFGNFTTEHAQNLPLSLTALTLSEMYVEEEVLDALPRGLKTLESSPLECETVTLPPSLTSYIGNDLESDSWATLPRSLKHLPSNTITVSDAELAADLPPSLAELMLSSPTVELIQALPCTKTIEKLWVFGSVEDGAFELVAGFPALKTLFLGAVVDYSIFTQFTSRITDLHIGFTPSTLKNAWTIPFDAPWASSLQSLRLFNMPGNGSEEEDDETDYTELQNKWAASLPSSLTKLDVSDIMLPTSIFAGLPRSLKELEVLLHWPSVTIPAFKNLPSGLQDIKVAAKSLSSNVKTSIAELAESLPRRLQSFYVRDPAHIQLTDENLVSLVDAMRPLLVKLPYLEVFSVCAAANAPGTTGPARSLSGASSWVSEWAALKKLEEEGKL